MYHGTGTLALNESFFGRIGNNDLVASWMILLFGIIKHNGQIQQMLMHVIIVVGSIVPHGRKYYYTLYIPLQRRFFLSSS